MHKCLSTATQSGCPTKPSTHHRPHLLGVRTPLRSASLPLLPLWRWSRPLPLLVEGEEAPSSTLGREAAQGRRGAARQSGSDAGSERQLVLWLTRRHVWILWQPQCSRRSTMQPWTRCPAPTRGLQLGEGRGSSVHGGQAVLRAHLDHQAATKQRAGERQTYQFERPDRMQPCRPSRAQQHTPSSSYSTCFQSVPPANL